MENFELINKHGSVYLTNIYEPDANQLLLEVKKSTTSSVEVDVPIGDQLLSGCKEVTVDETGMYFTISFNHYVAYHVLNESYANSDPDDEYISGDFGTFCIFQRSNYMSFILKETFANDMYPGELKHYGLFAADHIVHIISIHEPTIEIKESVS
jgi:hypothetical protein